MKNLTKWMLTAALAVGGLGLAAAPAKAAQIGVYIGTGGAYVPPSPGPGYVWIAGYYSGGYWVPGRWAFTGVYGSEGYYGSNFYGDRDDYYRDHDGHYRDRDDYYHRRDDDDHGRNNDRVRNNDRDNRGR